MTPEQFDAINWGAGLIVRYNNIQRRVAGVDFEERLVGVVNIDENPVTAEVQWKRCENVELVAEAHSLVYGAG